MEALAPVAGGTITAATIAPELFARWTTFIEAKPKTVATYTRAIRQFARYLAAEGITRPSRETIVSYRDSLTAAGKSAATVNAYLIAVKRFFQWAADEGIFPNVAEHVKGKTVSHNFKKDALTPRQARHVLETCDRSTLKGKRDFALLSLMMCTGIRTIEAARANAEDIGAKSLERKNGDTEDFHVLYLMGKGRDDRQEYVKLAPPVYEAIREYMDAASGGKALKKSAPLFLSTAHRNDGGRMTTRSISRIVKAHLLAAGINSSRLTAHSLRHTAGTIMLRNGTPLAEVQQILRHKDINTTMIYIHMMSREETTGESRAARAIFG